MSYRSFGAGPSDVATDPTGRIVGGAEFKVYSTMVGGQRITDLVDADGETPLPGIVTSATANDVEDPTDVGRIFFFAPDTYSLLYLDNGTGQRWAIMARDIGNILSTSLERSETAYTRSEEALDKANDAFDHVRADSKGIFKVTDYGAQATGIVDDAPAIQTAIDTAFSLGGGEVVFSPNADGGRTFLTLTPIILRDNVTLRGEGHPTITRKNPTGPYAVFISGSQVGRTGYGAGASNITMTGLTFRGDFQNSVDACALALHHSRNVFVQDCRFEEFSSKGHVIDLSGCENVTVRDCVFSGSNRDTGSHECIQVDVSSYSSVSAHVTGDAYDLLPTRNVLVTGCRFEPLTIGSTTYPCPQPFGSHAEYDQVWFENLAFTHNTIIDPPIEGTWLPGVLHFSCAKDVDVSHNTFRTTGATPVPATPIVSFVVAPRAFSSAADPNLPSSGYIDITPMKPTRISVQDNRFDGFTIARTARAALWFDGCDSLIVSGNHINGPTASPDGVIGVKNTVDAQVLSNNVRGTGARGIYASGTTTGRLVGNLLTGFTTPASSQNAGQVRFEEIAGGEASVVIETPNTAAYTTVTFNKPFSYRPMMAVARSSAAPNAAVTFTLNSVTATSARVYCIAPTTGTFYFIWQAVNP